MSKKIIGYSDEISVEPGDEVRFMVSCDPSLERYRAEIVRVFCGDTQPGAPGMKERLVETPVTGTYEARFQAIHPGSHVRVPGGAALDGLEDFTIQAMVFATLTDVPWQGLITRYDTTRESGFGLFIDDEGRLALVVGDGTGECQCLMAPSPLRSRHWYFVSATVSAQGGRLALRQELLKNYGYRDQNRLIEATMRVAPVADAATPLMFGASCRRDDATGFAPTGGFNGRIERPAIANRVLGRSDMEALRSGDLPEHLLDAVVGLWDFARAIDSNDVVDLSPNRLHGTAVNLPMRAMRGHNWTGDVMDWRLAPEQYAAIHFNDDAVGDCEWDDDFSFTVPDGLASGWYAAKLVSGDAEDYLPFFVRPPRGTTTARLLFLVPTASYLAYANWRFNFESQGAEILLNHIARMCAEEHYMIDHPEIGHSTYDLHNDGSPVCYTSRLRPVLNFRPKHTWLECYSADLHLVDWLEESGFAFDVATDEDLHDEGVGLLSGYACVITGTHPEYHSTAMWDAIYAYQQRGGRLMYMGGNGFFWRVAFHPDMPGMMEMRRGEDGLRSWDHGVGEYHLSFNGEAGGHWMRLGRPPNLLAGNGFVSQGFDFSSYYRRQGASFDPRAAFIFEGIGEDELIGDFGLQGGGAAGWEIDRFDHDLGTPPHALCLASSEGHTLTYTRSSTDLHGVGDPTTDDPANPMVRSDLVFYETPNGGAVFSTGSIAWCGSLCHNDYRNNVSRLTANVLRRFLDPAPFEMPEEAG